MKKLITLLLICEFCSISIFAVSQTEKYLDRICTELKIPKEKIANKYYYSINLPQDTNISIHIIPVKILDEEGYWSADIHLIKLSNRTSEILIHSILNEVIKSDAVSLYKIWLDAAPYYIQKNNRAFGIRLTYANNSRLAGFDEEQFLLIEEKNNNYNPILNIITSKGLSNGGGECENTELNDQKSILIIDKNNSSNDYYNIVEKIHYKHYFLDKDCNDTKKDEKDFINVFQYSDNSYKCKEKRKQGF